MEVLSVASRLALHAVGKPNASHLEAFLDPKNLPKNTPRAKYCIKWLPMLYYKCRRLNGLGSPFGIPQKIPLEWVGPQKLEKGKKTLRRTGVVEFLLVGIRISCAM